MALAAAVCAVLGPWPGQIATAQPLVDARASSSAHQGPTVHTSNAVADNGVVTTLVGNGGSATAGPAGAGVTNASANTYQPGGAEAESWQNTTETTANLATGVHTARVSSTPVFRAGTPMGISTSRLEDNLCGTPTGMRLDVSGGVNASLALGVGEDFRLQRRAARHLHLRGARGER